MNMRYIYALVLGQECNFINQGNAECVALRRKERKFDMRAIFLMLVAIIAAPAFAAVDVNCTCDGNEVTVSYVNTEPNHVRAFALDIILDVAGANILSVYGYDANVDDYYVYPGSIDVNADNNNIDDFGSLVANASKYPSGTYAGPPDSNAMTIEMASLYYPTGGSSPNAPADSNVLFKFKVYTPENANVTVQQNVKRGGIVMEDGNSPSSVNFSGCQVTVDCFPSDHPDYNTWVSVGKPDCWCYPRQCHGDTDNQKAGTAKGGYFYVGAADLYTLGQAWYVKEPPVGPGIDSVTDGICADFAHNIAGTAKGGYFRVGAADLYILAQYWYVKEPPVGPGVDPNCLTDYTPVP